MVLDFFLKQYAALIISEDHPYSPFLLLALLHVLADGFSLGWITLEAWDLFHETFIDPVGLAFGEVRRFTFLLKIFSGNAKRDQRFLSGPSQKIFCFFCAGSCFVNHAGSDPKNRRLAVGNVFGIPQNTGFFTARFLPFKRRNPLEVLGDFDVASFL
ncbi:hypothetical protein [Acutalibacter intestini]|uniref:hypothetical protein n=1 Tax=Acutalibacter intestini TaxID=3093659 RepID=UPI002AC8E5F4|nr:hypothetical protein [Acutalibacter sp. M00204]